MPSNVLLSSSLRAAPPEVTLVRARKKAEALGITRVTDITRLDRVGIPVYASIRPTAARGSLCVNAGKGMYPIEAEVGAYMEAIEFALAEPHGSHVSTVRATARDVLDGSHRKEAILDLCPKLGARIPLDSPMHCVVAQEFPTGKEALVPAELVFLPFRPHAQYTGFFGTSSNGLASGNTLREATVHGLCELIERDVRAFQAVNDESEPIDLDRLEDPSATLVAKIRAAGLELYVRSAKNVFGVPYFAAILYDPDACLPHLVNSGYGCHPHRSVAFVRAVAEAAQSRLSFIHGGRDDLLEHHERFRGFSLARKRAYARRAVATVARGAAHRVPISSVEDHSHRTTTIERCEQFLLGRLKAAGFERAYRVAFCPPREPLQVVRVIVPCLEQFGESVFRAGPRLRDHARAS
jgi:ribosomal protein S12 methylthiotransferase accessory factor